MRPGRFLLAVALVAGGAAAALRAVPVLLGRLPWFRVEEVEMEGGRYLSREAAVAAAGIPSGASVWDDPEAWEERLRAHPLVRDARVRRRLPGTLVLVVDERVPVALAATPVLVPVDREGLPLPIDPTRRSLDLPVIAVRGGGPAREGLRLLAREVARWREESQALVAGLSELRLEGSGEAVARLVDPGVELRFLPPVPFRRVREGLRALADALDRFPDARPRAVDLRYQDQVVVGLAPRPRRTAAGPPAPAGGGGGPGG